MRRSERQVHRRHAVNSQQLSGCRSTVQPRQHIAHLQAVRIVGPALYNLHRFLSVKANPQSVKDSGSSRQANAAALYLRKVE